MNRSQKHGWALVIIGAFLLSRNQMFFGTLLLLLGAWKIFRVWRDPRYKISKLVKRDAQFFNCVVPQNWPVQKQLFSIYTKYQQSLTARPQLTAEYNEVIRSMWTELTYCQQASDWLVVTRPVLKEWPLLEEEQEIINHGTRRPSQLAESLRKAQEATKMWREAKLEAKSSSIR